MCIRDRGYHEDELLTYNLANSANTLKTDGEWNSGADFIDYLSVEPPCRTVLDLARHLAVLEAAQNGADLCIVGGVQAVDDGLGGMISKALRQIRKNQRMLKKKNLMSRKLLIKKHQ